MSKKNYKSYYGYKIVLWLTPQGKYYHKVVKGSYYDYKVGLKNQYDHEVVHIVYLNDFLSSKSMRVNYKKMLISDLVRFLEKMK